MAYFQFRLPFSASFFPTQATYQICCKIALSNVIINLAKMVIAEMFMKRNQQNSYKSFPWLGDEGGAMRRRNLSLGSAPGSQPQSSLPFTPLLLQHAHPVYSPLRNLSKSTKPSRSKKARFATQSTKLCHQNILQYNLMKRKVTQIITPVRGDQSLSFQLKRPRLSVKNLSIDLQHEFGSCLSRRGRKNLESEGVRNLQYQRIRREQVKGVRVVKNGRNEEKQWMEVGSKKYNQLTLREIAEVEQVPGFNILLKLREWQHREGSKIRSTVASEDFCLQGW